MTRGLCCRAKAAVVSLLPILALLVFAAPAFAQISIGGSAPAGPTIPPGVQQDGIYATAPVRVDGTTLFRIAIPQTAELSEQNAQFAVSVRAQFAQSAIAQVLAEKPDASGTIYDDNSLSVSLKQEDDQRVIQVTDAEHKDPLPLLTVTAGDAQFAKQPIDELAGHWRDDLQGALSRGLQKRQPEEYAKNFSIALWVLAGVVAATVVLVVIYVVLRRRVRALRAEVSSREDEVRKARSEMSGGDGKDEGREGFIAALSSSLEPAAQLRMATASLGLIVWIALATWVVAILVVLSLFPNTTPLAVDLIDRTIAVVVIWIVALVANRVADVVIGRFFLAWSKAGPFDDIPRRTLRTPTIVAAIGGFKSVAIFFVAALLTLGQLGFSALSVLALGGAVAVGFGLAAQNLVLDFVNGFFVLTEDQYAIGDNVVIGANKGLVEYMSLRIVRLRDDEGSVVTIPHGLARIVVNQTRDWSRTDYRVTVATGTDAEQALDLLLETIATMRAEPDWGEAIKEVEFSGVQSISRLGIVLRVRIKTEPGEQWKISRELHRRVVAAFAAAGIDLGLDPGTPVAAPTPP